MFSTEVFKCTKITVWSSRTWISWSYCNLSTARRHVRGAELVFQPLTSTNTVLCREKLRWPMYRWLAGSQSLSRRFLIREKFIFSAGIRTLDRSTPLLLVIQTTPSPYNMRFVSLPKELYAKQSASDPDCGSEWNVVYSFAIQVPCPWRRSHVQ